MDSHDEDKPVNLEKHRRYSKKTPYGLLLKAALILLLFYLISYGINIVLEKQRNAPELEENSKIVAPSDSTTLEIDISNNEQ